MPDAPNREALLLDDVLWVNRAREEHDALADALGGDVAVRLLADLLAETLRDDTARNETGNGRSGSSTSGVRVDALSDWFPGLPAESPHEG